MGLGLQNHKFISVTPPAVIVDNASYTTTEIDTLGYDYLSIICYLGATDIAMTALKLTESDTAGSGHADITGATFAADLPSATDDNKSFAFYVDLRGRKRYIDLVATAGDGTAGTYLAAFAFLSNAEVTPTSASERGLDQQVII